MIDTRRPTSSTEDKEPPPSPTLLLPLNNVFWLCAVSHLLAALYAPISDCDETFNYWEPLHYLIHGYGLQTWEYSPEYGIRSWAYIVLHAIPAKLISVFAIPKTFQFYSIRTGLAILCAATETRLYSAISRTLNARIGAFYVMIVLFSPGLFQASVAFLPSTFAMYTSALGLAAFMDWRNGPKTAQGITWFAAGALLGWPFAGALILPFVAEDWVVGLITGRLTHTFGQYFRGAVHTGTILVVQLAIDSAFYRRVLFIPWRIVSYNVFNSGDRGPDIFGTEPWHFYVRNLVLNFNLWFILAIMVGPLLLIQVLFFKQRTSKQTVVRTMVLIAPFYLWFTVFTVQPHKEERFMFPAYPFLALNAAVALHMVLSWVGQSDPRTLLGKVPPQIKLMLVLPVVFAAVNIGLLRILGTVTAYRAPLQIFDALASEGPFPINTTVCIGKEWYRFPSSYFLPTGVRAGFIPSAFDGLLPGEFYESTQDSGPVPGTWMIPVGMNDRNEADASKYAGIAQCAYLVDSSLPSHQPSLKEPDFVNSDYWERLSCASFLDSGATHIIARTIWVPDLPFVPIRFRRVWGEFCLLRRSGKVLSHGVGIRPSSTGRAV